MIIKLLITTNQNTASSIYANDQNMNIMQKIKS